MLTKVVVIVNQTVILFGGKYTDNDTENYLSSTYTIDMTSFVVTPRQQGPYPRASQAATVIGGVMVRSGFYLGLNFSTFLEETMYLDPWTICGPTRRPHHGLLLIL